MEQKDQQKDQQKINILKRVKSKCPAFYELEVLYQEYRSQFSEAYFKGSEWYYGDCLYDWYINQPLKSSEFLEEYIFLSFLKYLNN